MWPLLLGGIGALAGYANTRAQEKQAEVDNQMNALETKYSPWISPQYRQVTKPGSMIGSVLGGGASGGLMGAQFGGLSSWAPGGGPTTNVNQGIGFNTDPGTYGKWYSPGLNRASFFATPE